MKFYLITIVVKGAPRLRAARCHPPPPHLKAGDAPSWRWHLSAQGAVQSTGVPRPPTSFFSFSFSFFFFFFFSFSSFLTSGYRGQKDALILFFILFFGTKTTSFDPFYFKKNRSKRYCFGACSFKIKNRLKRCRFGPVFPSSPLFWLFSTRQLSQILPYPQPCSEEVKKTKRRRKNRRKIEKKYM